MLETQVVHADGAADGTPVVVLLHGRGADASDLAPLGRGLPDGITLVLPRAPHPAAPWDYGPGWAWYRYQGEDRPEVESFRSSQESLHQLVEQLPALLGYQPGTRVLGGFSQGGTMSLGYALQHPGRVPAVVVFSGFLPDHPDVEVTAENVAGASIWWGHGTRDPAIPHTLASRGRAALRSAGAELATRDYPMGHGISPQELQDLSDWLNGRI